ncbi:MAG: hypothetical protein WCP89_03540 [archaeon]
MEKSEEKYEKKENKIRSWLRKPSNILIVCIFVFLIILRLYYTSLTANQPLWWDEAEYMSAAKSYAGIIDFKASDIRTPGFPLIASVFFMIGLREGLILKFFLEFIPSMMALFLFFCLMKEMYPDKRIAIVSTLLFGVLWEHLFYSMRFHTENFALIFQFLAMIVLIKVYLKKEKVGIITPKSSWMFIILFSILALIFRPTNAPFIPALLLFGLLINLSYLKKVKKIYTLMGAIAIIVVATLFAFNLSSIPVVKFYYNAVAPPAFHFFYSPFAGYYTSVILWLPPILLYLFYLGLFIALARIVLIADKLKDLESNSNDLEMKSDLLNILLILSVVLSFVFILKTQAIEYRWFFMLLPAMFAFTSKPIILISDAISKYLKVKNIATIIIIIIVALGAYNQLSHADNILKAKIDSYSQVRDAGLWIKENSNKGDSVFTNSITQNTYYSERETYGFGSNETEFYNSLKEKSPKYVIVSALENYPAWALSPSQNFTSLLSPVKAFYLDAQQKQMVLIVYKYNK